MSIPYIAHVSIKNYRNFEKLDIDMDEKQLVIGENATGKSNYIKAIRLILDPTMSDQDKFLSAEDFSNTLSNPMENGEEIEISLYFDNYKDNKALMCIIEDAIVSLNGRQLAKITCETGDGSLTQK
ncbi:MAG: putative ATP-dependent endonuclease of the family [Thermoanaerobacteraceae bacterium]|jgi:putative ATP-dependent endonuclease of OLD family|nr:putative ATP-dependent endonuclease of the family [Thermoanaerobacteraceae bacterium]